MVYQKKKSTIAFTKISVDTTGMAARVKQRARLMATNAYSHLERKDREFSKNN